MWQLLVEQCSSRHLISVGSLSRPFGGVAEGHLETRVVDTPLLAAGCFIEKSILVLKILLPDKEVIRY